MTLAFEPGGVTIGQSVPVAGALELDVVLQPTLLSSAFIDILLAFTGIGTIGLSDVFCVRPVPDEFCVRAGCDTFTVPAGRTAC